MVVHSILSPYACNPGHAVEACLFWFLWNRVWGISGRDGHCSTTYSGPESCWQACPGSRTLPPHYLIPPKYWSFFLQIGSLSEQLWSPVQVPLKSILQMYRVFQRVMTIVCRQSVSSLVPTSHPPQMGLTERLWALLAATRRIMWTVGCFCEAFARLGACTGCGTYPLSEVRCPSSLCTAAGHCQGSFPPQLLCRFQQALPGRLYITASPVSMDLWAVHMMIL
jgi:hypothetical protein